MHLTKPLGLQITGEGKPRIKHPKDKDWYGTTLPWSSIGYEVKVTPMQVLTLYNAVANNGVMVKPFFVKRISNAGKLIKEYQPEIIEQRIASPETIKNLRIMMEGVVLRGTGSSLRNPNYTIAGKTGTALVADGRRGYAKPVYRSSFCGYFPADNPQYTCFVMVNAPSKGVYYGGAVAGPVFKEIADKVYANSHNLHGDIKLVLNSQSNTSTNVRAAHKQQLEVVLNKLGQPTSKNDTTEENGSEWAQAIVSKEGAKISSRKYTKNLMPDVVGMGLKDALYLLENEGLQVEVVGVGKIKEQSITAGAALSKGLKVTIKLG